MPETDAALPERTTVTVSLMRQVHPGEWVEVDRVECTAVLAWPDIWLEGSSTTYEVPEAGSYDTLTVHLADGSVLCEVPVTGGAHCIEGDTITFGAHAGGHVAQRDDS